MTSLSHHGIKGQQWGVRHGPPYPIQKGNGVTIRAGTPIKRLSVYDESIAKGKAYVTYNNWDVDHYKGFFGARLKAIHKNAPVYSLTFTAKQDMKSPDFDTRMKTFKEIYNEDLEVRKEMARYYRSQHIKFAPLFIYERKYRNMSEQDLERTGYNTFVRSIGDANRKTAEKYFNALIKKGYNFVMDDMDGQYMLKYGKEPAIVFDRETSLNYKGREEVHWKEITDNLKKTGRRVKV